MTLPLRARPRLLTAALVLLAPPAGAQHVATLRSGAVSPPVASAPPVASVLAAPSRHPSVWRSVGTGALIGGAVAVVVVGVAYVQLQDTECMGCELLIPPVIVGGTVLGGATGYVVHRIRFR